MKINEITEKLIGKNIDLPRNSKKMINRRVLEIIAPDTRLGASKDKINQLFNRFYATKARVPHSLNNAQAIIEELEKIKLNLSEINPIYYDNHLLEIVNDLQPGDILVRKYHENNPNLICDMQNLFGKQGYREAYKCSHLAIYLGEINGDYWVAEATMPNGIVPQMRRVRINDPRFELKEKNQYIIIRKRNRIEAREAARLAENYVTKLLPESEKVITEEEFNGSLKYSLVEAVRSIWRSPRLGFFGKHRLLKYYSDYKNGIAFEYLGRNRAFFCSQFALIMESMAELNKSPKFQEFIQAHPMPLKYDGTKEGIQLKLSKLWYSVRKGVWARWMTFKYSHQIEQSVSTKLDALRTNPQQALIYMMDHSEQYEVVGIVTRRKDYR